MLSHPDLLGHRVSFTKQAHIKGFTIPRSDWI
jgi:hypothetical protein